MVVNIHVLIHPSSLLDVNKYKIESIILFKHEKSLRVEFDDLSFLLKNVEAEANGLLKELLPAAMERNLSNWYALSEANKKGLPFVEDEHKKYVQKIWRSIASKYPIKVYIKLGEIYKTAANKAFTIQAQLPILKFKAVKSSDNIYQVQVTYQLGKELFEAAAVIREHFFLMIADKLYILTYNDSKLLNWLDQNLAKRSIKNLQLFEENYLAVIEKQYVVDRTDIVATIEINATPIFKLYIRETLGTYILLEPRAYYDDYVVEELVSNQAAVHQQVVKGKPIIINRAITAESEFIQLIKKQHLNFAKQFNNYFQISFGDAIKSKWFYQFFKTMLHHQVDIVGMDLMQHFRYSEHKAVTNIKTIEAEKNYFLLEIKVAFGKETVALLHIQKALRNQQHSLPLSDNSIAVLDDEWLAQYALIIKHGVIENETKIKVSKTFFIADELNSVNNNGNEVKPINFQQQLLPNDFKKLWLQWQSDNTTALCATHVNAVLRPYQQKGADWLWLLSQIGAGALLADDMGLGKTLQTITYLQNQIKNNSETIHLIVAPASLIYNWQKEFEKFTNQVKLDIYHGASRNLEQIMADKVQVIITTYATARNDIEQLSTCYFDTIVLDESHNIKNHGTLITKAVLQLQTAFKIALSGTPITNGTRDLYSQFAFLLPGLFYSISFFNQEYAIPIEEQKDEEKLAQLQKITAPYILRRTKEKVAADLPEKIESTIWCAMQEDQRMLYNHVKEQGWKSLSAEIAQNGLAKSKMSAMVLLQRLRQVCDAPALIPDDLQLTKNVASIKLDILVDEIKENTGDNKIIVFTQFVKMIEQIEQRFNETNITYYTITGATTAKKRDELVQAFQSQGDTTKVFIISLHAGGVGLTITKANYIFMVDPWWNKAVENQAFGRSHRIGQTQTVFAYKMICKDTVEEKILEIQERKTNLSEALIQIEEDFVKQLTDDDLAYLFS